MSRRPVSSRVCVSCARPFQSAESGGDSLWTDGFALAEELRRLDPAAFEILATTPVLHQDITDKWDMRKYTPRLHSAPPVPGALV